jgi:hypothetical protein
MRFRDIHSQEGRVKKRILFGTILGAFCLAGAAYAAENTFNQVKATTFDPAKTYLVGSDWQSGIGCPTNAKTFDGSTTSTYTDPACPTGDSKDKKNEGLLLAKTGPTSNYASAQADLRNVKGTVLTELGYDLRKPASTNDPRGSHCGAGAPRFNVTTSDGTLYFVGCNSPAPDSQTVGNGWLRLRWGAGGTLLAYPQAGGGPVNISGMTVKSIQIVFDEGQDTGPDNFGLAVLDNIDVNGTLVGRGSHGDDGEGD